MNDGAFSSIKFNKLKHTITKTYVEHRGETDAPYLNLIGSNIYVINWLSENHTHNRLCQAIPNMFPHIHAYEEHKYLDIPEAQRPPIPEPIKHRKPESLMLCKVEMDYLPFPSLNANIISQLNKSDLLCVLKQWFELQLKIIKEAHVLPYDVHVGNMLYDKAQQKIHLIDYGHYEFFELVDRLVPTSTQHQDLIYWFDPINNKHKYFKDCDEIKAQSNFQLSDEETKDLFMFRLMWFSNNRQSQKLHYIMAEQLGIDECVGLHVKVMTELGFSKKHVKLVSTALVHQQQLFSIGRSIRNWLAGPPYGNYCASNIILSLMINNSEIFKTYYDELNANVKQLQAMDKNTFGDYYYYTLLNTKPKAYCALAYMMYLKYEPTTEYNNILVLVKNNLQSIKAPLYRCETTDRFDDNKLVVGGHIKWNHIISATENKHYALSYLANNRGNTAQSHGTPRHYLFVFNGGCDSNNSSNGGCGHDIKACYLHDYYGNMTIYTRRYNASDASDTNRLNCFHPHIVAVSNEWIIEPFKTFRITKTYTITTKETIPAQVIATTTPKDIKPIRITSNTYSKESYTENVLNVNVIELSCVVA